MSDHVESLQFGAKASGSRPAAAPGQLALLAPQRKAGALKRSSFLLVADHPRQRLIIFPASGHQSMLKGDPRRASATVSTLPIQ
jgi:hypothetical protein